MRNSIIGAMMLLAGGGAAAVSAADTTGNNILLNGSDTLTDVTDSVLFACPNALADGIDYHGGGSGVGAGQMIQNNQQISPMSRTLKNDEYCGVTPTSLPGEITTSTQALVIGLDGIAVMAGTANACGTGVAVGGQTLAVTDPNGNPIKDCNGCDPGTNNYRFTSSLDVLRLLYGGVHHDGATFSCSSDVRKSLVKRWSSLFSTACASGQCPGGLTHLWRPKDLSDTADEFVRLVGFGSRGIGALSDVPQAVRRTNPFCNGADANAAPGAACNIEFDTCPANTACDARGGTVGRCMPTSFGGSTDFSDLDPIRAKCATTDQVCEQDGTLGLVLPIFLPDAPGFDFSDDPLAEASRSDLWPPPCSVQKFDLVSSGNVHEVCPSGTGTTGSLPHNFLGACYQPYLLNGTTHNFACLSKSNAHDVSANAGFDGRAYNLPIKAAASGGVYLRDARGREMTKTFFRIHQTTASAGSTITCQQRSVAAQIGCLVASDPCSLGYAGREAAAQGNNQALSLDGVFPTDANITHLVTGGTPVYELSRRMYLASLVGFGNLQGGEKELASCFANNAITKAVVIGYNFVALPSPGVKCLSYDDAPLPGCGDKPVVTGCSDLPPGWIQNAY